MFPCAFWSYTVWVQFACWNWLLECQPCFKFIFFCDLPQGFHLRAGVLSSPARFSSVQFSHSVTSDSPRPHGLQHTRLPCPLLSPRVYPNPCPLSRWCHPTISSSVILFSSCPQSFPASGSFPTSQPFASGGQSTGASASASVLLSLECMLLGSLSRHNKNLEWWILKPLGGSQLSEDRPCYSIQVSNGPCYSS